MPRLPTLPETALMLRNANPEAWDMFLRVFENYTSEITVAVTEAPPGDVLVLQGQARQCLKLLRLFKECDSTSRKPAP